MTTAIDLPRPGGPRAQLRLMRKIMQEPIPVLDELAERYGGACGFGFGPLRAAVIGNAAMIAELHRRPTSQYRWGHKFNVLGFVVGEQSMIVSDGEDHHRRRASVTHGFARRRLNGWVPMIVAEADDACDRILAAAGNAGPLNLYPFVRRMTLAVVVRAMFGDRLAARVDEIGDRFEGPQAYLESSAFHQAPHPFPFTTRARVRSDRRALDAIVDEEIARWRMIGEGDPSNVLATLVRTAELSDAEIRDQVVTLIGAGYDSTAASLAWVLWCATTAPGVWDRLAEEATAAFAEPDDDGLRRRLGYADRVMRETLRLHPAGAFVPREAAEDLQIGGYRIPKGTLILWSAHLAGRDPAVWSDPLRFDPDRFADLDDEQREVTNRSWVPFGGGTRNCIGFALAQMELTIAAARFAQRLKLTPTAPEPPRPKGMIVNRPLGGVPMRVSAR